MMMFYMGHVLFFNSDKIVVFWTVGLTNIAIFIFTLRLGSVGQDTQLCLWDITEDVLTQTNIFSRTKTSSNNNNTSLINNSSTGNGTLKCHNNSNSTSNHKDTGEGKSSNSLS